MEVKYFKKYSDGYRDHLKEMQKTATEKDSEAIAWGLYWISYYKELSSLLSEHCEDLEVEGFELKRDKQ